MSQHPAGDCTGYDKETDQIEGTADQSTTAARDSTCDNDTREKDFTLFIAGQTLVVNGLEDSQSDTVHKELVVDGRDQSLLQAEYSLILGHDVKGVKDVLVVDRVLAAGFEFPLQLDTCFDHF